ncbi:c-type cytochrome [Psychromonas antarctica]|uniref:c-type cytochrome n=1 Tax=Psychromonas antarctica TaxID=67573 RepID=UPI001EE8CDFF|nr:hypothetical protein [Psychromonas antarctica]MCG6202607.1 hypothetical protein [Psychromonas antarctica]
MIIRRPFRLTSLSVALLLVGCGGSDSSSPGDTTSSTAVISGTVPGTFIEAFFADGSYYSTNSIDNGEAEHPFSLTIPSSVNFHLVMTTNKGTADQIITPIRITSGGVTSALINTSVTFNLGYIPLAMNLADIIDANGDGVVDSPLIITPDLPEGAQVVEVTLDALDSDNDGIPNIYEDDDNDGEFNLEDLDDDNDGINDVDESDDDDSDDDGVDDQYDSDQDNDGVNDNSPVTTYTPVSAYTPKVGRLLASQCFQCHGTNGNSTNDWDSIAGESVSEIVEEMQEFKSGEEDEPIMAAQAHGYSDAEISALAEWLATQSSSEGED